MRRIVLLLVVVALLLIGAGAAYGQGSPTCRDAVGVVTHGQHIVGDYVTGIGGIGGALEWPPNGEVGEVVGAQHGVVVKGGPGPGFHFPNGFAPGASFCLEHSQSPGLHLGH